MGNSSSSNTYSSFVSSFNENLLNVASNSVNSATINCSGKQNMNIDFSGAKISNCGIDITQNMTVDCKVSAFFSSKTEVDIKTMIQQAFDETVKNSNDVTQKFLSTSSSSTSNNTNMRTYISNVIQKNFKFDTSNACIAQMLGSQNAVVSFKNVDLSNCPSSVKVGQSLQLYGLVNCITNQISGIVSSDAVFTAASKNVDQGNKVTQTGISDMVDWIANIFTSPYFMIIVIVLGILGVIGAYIYYKQKSGGGMAAMAAQQQPQTMIQPVPQPQPGVINQGGYVQQPQYYHPPAPQNAISSVSTFN